MSADRHITTRIWSGARLSVVLLLFAAGVARLDAAPKQPILVKNVSMKVPNNIELSGTEPTHAFLWVDVEFDLVNIGRHSVILKACNKTPIGTRRVRAFGPITKHWATSQELSGSRDGDSQYLPWRNPCCQPNKSRISPLSFAASGLTRMTMRE
jgi:hypothetical protein